MLAKKWKMSKISPVLGAFLISLTNWWECGVVVILGSFGDGGLTNNFLLLN